jgi:hypothetical protein
MPKMDENRQIEYLRYHEEFSRSTGRVKKDDPAEVDKLWTLAYGTAATLLETHQMTGVSLDRWIPCREFVEFLLDDEIHENGV